MILYVQSVSVELHLVSFPFPLFQNALRLMEQIDRVDENLKNLGIEIDYRRLSRHVKIVGSFWLLNAIIILGIFIAWIVRTTIPLSCSSTFTYIYITNAQSIVLYDYNTAILYVKNRKSVFNSQQNGILVEKYSSRE